MIKAVLFDFDETLQDRTLAFEGYMDSFIDEFLPDISQELRDEYKEEMRVSGKGGYVNRVEWCTHLVEKWGWKDAPPATVLAAHYDNTFGDHNVIFENSEKTLRELKKSGYITGVITNGPSYLQNHKMDTSGLRPFCDIVVVSGDVGVHKPDPALFEYTANLLKINTNECVYVGDHPINDIQGALSAGMKAVRMNYGWFKDCSINPDIPTINEISQVLDVIKTI